MEQDDCIITAPQESSAERKKSSQQVDIPIQWANNYRSVTLLSCICIGKLFTISKEMLKAYSESNN